MIITDITKKKGTRYQIDVDNEYWTILDIEIIADFHLKKGIEITKELKDEIQSAADYRKSKEYALYLLGYREHSRAELITKLNKKVDFSIANSVADRMEELGLLDDRRYAEKLAKYLTEVKKRGPHRVYNEMVLKGLDRDIVKEVLENIEVSTEPIREIIEKKYLKNLEDEKGKQKVIAALLRRGYDYSLIKEAMSEFTEE